MKCAIPISLSPVSMLGAWGFIVLLSIFKMSQYVQAGFELIEPTVSASQEMGLKSCTATGQPYIFDNGSV